MDIIGTLQRRKGRFYRSLTIGLGVTLVVFIADYLKLTQSEDSKVFDVFSIARTTVEENVLGWPPMKLSSEIRIVAINDDAFKQNLASRQPLPRWYLAGLVDVVARAGAKVIVFDISFRDKTND